MKKLTLLLSLLLSLTIFAQNSETKNKNEIMKVLNMQQEAWSNTDIEGFMQGYWKSDSLKFFGKNGLTQGWENTLSNYKKGYPTADEMGKLSFSLKTISRINKGAYFVMGEFHLSRKAGDANGIFMIIFKKINGKWKIIADTSC